MLPEYWLDKDSRADMTMSYIERILRLIFEVCFGQGGGHAGMHAMPSLSLGSAIMQSWPQGLPKGAWGHLDHRLYAFEFLCWGEERERNRFCVSSFVISTPDPFESGCRRYRLTLFYLLFLISHQLENQVTGSFENVWTVAMAPQPGSQALGCVRYKSFAAWNLSFLVWGLWSSRFIS